MNSIKTLLLQQLISALLGVLKQNGGETLKRFEDRLLDIVEEMVEDTETQLDDTVVLPIIESIRLTNNIPDYPDEDKSGDKTGG